MAGVVDQAWRHARKPGSARAKRAGGRRAGANPGSRDGSASALAGRAAIDRTLEDDTQRSPVSPRTLEKVDRIHQEITALRRKLGGIRKRRARLRKEARGLLMKSSILEHAERIDALVEEGQKLHALEQQIQNLQPEIDQLQAELQQRIAQQVESSMPGAVTALTTATQGMPPVTAKTLAALRIPARPSRTRPKPSRTPRRNWSAANAKPPSTVIAWNGFSDPLNKEAWEKRSKKSAS